MNIHNLGIKKNPKPKNPVQIILEGDKKNAMGEIEEEPNIIMRDMRKKTDMNRELIMKRLMSNNILIENQIPSQSIIPYISEPLQEPIESTETVAKLSEPEEAEAEAEAFIIHKNPDKKETDDKKIPRKKGKEIKYDIITDFTRIKIGDELVNKRLPITKPVKMQISPYYMTNRAIYIDKIARLLQPYREDIAQHNDEISCDSLNNTTSNIELLTHQKIVRHYLNLFTPYRGLLLYHGLGSGKTCSSIAIAEGMKSDRQIVLMTPASLKMNFFSELKKCGDHLYKKNQFWEFVSIDGNPEYVGLLSQILNLTPAYVKMHKGAWLVNTTKSTNFAQLSTTDQKNVDEQINAMIRAKYIDINYNGINQKKLKELTKDDSINPFDHRTVIIDEAHNFVSRILNKLNKPTSISYKLYHYLMDATDVRIILLTGTPIINYVNEIAILYNILRGRIKTWELSVRTTTKEKINSDTVLEMFVKDGLNTYDYVEYSGNHLTVTRNPYGFINKLDNRKAVELKEKNAKEEQRIIERMEKRKIEKEAMKKTKKKSPPKASAAIKGGKTKKKSTAKANSTVKNVIDIKPLEEKELEKDETMDNYYQHMNYYEGGADEFAKYSGVVLDPTGNISDDDFEKHMLRILNKRGIVPVGNVDIVKYKILPDSADEFNALFINADTKDFINKSLFQRRILGLTSYFRSAQEKLLPSFIKNGDSNYHMVYVEMSPYQFSVYKDIRKQERDQESKKKKAKAMHKGVEEDISSTYKIFSRAACNFAFPSEQERPRPNKGETNELNIDAITNEIRKNADDYEEDDLNEDEHVKETADILSYQAKITEALAFLKLDPMRPREKEYLNPDGLMMYSPKFLAILERLLDENNEGLHLLYSQFRTIEGIGILKLILEANGFSHFRIEKNNAGLWSIVEGDEVENNEKPKFVLYTGTETAEEKEIMRNIYNSAWEFVPSNIVERLRRQAENNFMGQIIKLMMITSSGAEGINLRNTRFVHIVEPYWNMVRIDQVVGRARRICSHKDLPEALRTVKVFVYLSVLSKEQKEDEKNQELRIKDISRLDKKTPVTTDETLFEIASIKDQVNQQILRAIKETSIDCSLYNTNPDEPLVCFSFGKVTKNDFSSQPNLLKDKSGIATVVGPEKMVRWKARELIIDGKKYALNTKTNIFYSFESYEANLERGEDLVEMGRLVEKEIMIDGRKEMRRGVEFVK